MKLKRYRLEFDVWGLLLFLIIMKGAFHAFAPIGTGSPETKQILEEKYIGRDVKYEHR